MSYTTPPTFVAATELAAADLDILGDDILYLKAQTDLAVLSGFYATRSTNQSIATSTDTNVSLTTEVYDQGGWIAVTATTATVPSSAIPPGYTTVVLDIRCSAFFAGSAVGSRRVTILQNGSAYASKAIDAPGTSGLTVDMSIHATAVSGDTFNLQVWQDSGGSLNIADAALDISVYKPVS